MLYQVIMSLYRGYPVNLADILMQVAAVVFIAFCVTPLHEFSHGWAANKLGDPTAKHNGRLTMNPVASMDLFGTICLFLFGYGWAKPVPVNPMNFRNPKRDMALTALAGPVSNLLAALVGALLLNTVLVFGNGLSDVVMSGVQIFFYYYISINVMLAVFNLIPVPPLDGSRILGAFLSDRALYRFYQYERQLSGLMFLLLFTGVLNIPLSFLRSGALQGISWLAALPFRAFGF